METQNELEKLKNEILDKLRPEKKHKRRLRWGGIAVTSILVLLLLFSVIQTIQSISILDKINSGLIKPATAGALPSSLQNLPDMVGGC